MRAPSGARAASAPAAAEPRATIGKAQPRSAARRAASWAAASSASSSGCKLGLTAVAAGESELDQAIGEPGVLGQQRAVQVGADHVRPPHPLEAVPAVVAVAADHPAQGLGAVAEVGAPAVVLEPGQLPRARRRGRPRSRCCRSAAARARAPSPGRRGRGPGSARRRAGSCGREAGSRRKRRAPPRRPRRPRRGPSRLVATMSSATIRWSRSWPPPT